MIFSIAVVGLAGFGMLSALAHFILRLKTKPARKYKQKIQKVKQCSFSCENSMKFNLESCWRNRISSSINIKRRNIDNCLLGTWTFISWVTFYILTDISMTYMDIQGY